MQGTEAEFRDTIGNLLLRDVGAVRREIESYPDDAGPWQTVPGLRNPGGTLALHLAGNLQHFLGAVLCRNGYVRDRDAEFARRDVPRVELTRELDAAISTITTALTSVTEAQLTGIFPEEHNGLRVPTHVFFLHLATHLSYHLGQLDYHRRCVTGDSTAVGTPSMPALLLSFPPATDATS